jgi:hypothetical protein
MLRRKVAMKRKVDLCVLCLLCVLCDTPENGTMETTEAQRHGENTEGRIFYFLLFNFDLSFHHHPIKPQMNPLRQVRSDFFMCS